MAGAPPGVGGMTGILNWSLAHSDGTAPPRPVSEEDRKWFYEAMAAATVDPVARMKVLTADLAAASASPAALDDADQDALLEVLGELQDHVEDVDCACDLSKIGGLPPLLALLRGPHASLRAAAAEVLAVCAQNNAKAQAQLLDGGVMAPLLAVARSDEDETARHKALFALASLIRHCPPAEAAFRLGDGFGVLVAAAASGHAKLARRALDIARHLLTSGGDPTIATVVDLGFIRLASAALPSPDRPLREAALALLLDLARCADFDALPQAVDQLRAPALAARLAGVRAALGALSTEEADRAADEAALADALHRMLEPPGAQS